MKFFFTLFFIVFSKQTLPNTTDEAHEKISTTITSLATKIDTFFADESALNYTNKTQLRIFKDTIFQEAKGPTAQADVRFQLQLPGLQKKLQLILESSDDTNDDDEQRDQTELIQKNENRQEDRNTKAGLQYFFETPDIKTNLSSGVIFNQLDPRFFVRLRARKNIKTKNWLIKPEQEVFYTFSEIIRTTTELDFDRRVTENFLFRFINNFRWNDEEYIISGSNGASLYQKINPKIGMSYNFRAISSDTPSWAINNYIFSLGYRQLLYKDWLFWTLSPSLSFPRENNFHRTPALIIRVEAVMGYI